MICYSNKYISIFKNSYEINNLQKLLKWEMSYIRNDISVINYDYDSNILTCALYFKTKFYIATLFLNKYTIDVDNRNLISLVNQIFGKYNDIYDVLVELDRHLYETNSITHEKFKLSNRSSEKNIIEWNPYEYLNINDSNSFNILKLKTNANKYFDDVSEIKSGLKANKIIDIIISELVSIDNNTKFEIIIDDNIFDFNIKLKNFSNEKLLLSLENSNLDGIIFNVKIDKYIFPYYPPKINFENNIKNNLDLSISKSLFFNKSNWNVTNNFLDLFNEIQNIINIKANDVYILDIKFKKCNFIIKELLLINNIDSKSTIKLTFNTIKINKQNTINDSKCWKSGIGYGTKGRKNWNIEKYYDEVLEKNKTNYNLLTSLFEEISNIIDIDNYLELISKSHIFDVILFFIKQINLMNLNEHLSINVIIINIFNLIDVLKWKDKPLEKINQLSSHFKILCSEIELFKSLNKKHIEKNKLKLFNDLNEIYDSLKVYDIENNKDNLDADNIQNVYCKKMKEINVDSIKLNINKYFYKKKDINSSNKCIKKLIAEISTYKDNLPVEYDSSIFLRYDENNLCLIKILIIGPKDTPYENGCFIFDVFIPDKYPQDPPMVNLMTTGNGTVRFNPNLYNDGKVCLSLLGTWRGEGSEKWNENTSTLLQVLISIQSLIFVENPYFNEPGYEKSMNTPSGDILNFEYNDNIRENTIRWAINNNLENLENEFKDVIRNHFYLKKNDLIQKIESWHLETKRNKKVFSELKNKCIDLLNNLKNI